MHQRLAFFQSTSKWLILGSIMGVLSGILGFLFVLAIDLGSHVFLKCVVGLDLMEADGSKHLFTGMQHVAFSPWTLLLVMFIGGSLVGLLIQRLMPNDTHSDADYVVNSYHNHKGQISWRFWVGKVFAALGTLTTGGAAGREGPTILIAGGVSRVLATRLRMSSRDRRLLMIAAVAGGIAGVFRAPLAGAFFAVEMLYFESDLEAEALIPSFLSAIISYCTFGLLQSFIYPDHSITQSLFAIPDGLLFEAEDYLQLLGYLGIALSCSAISWLMRSSIDFGKSVMKRIVFIWLRAGVGAVLVGVLALAVLNISQFYALVPEGSVVPLSVLGDGYGALQYAFHLDFQHIDNHLSIAALLVLIAVAKTLAVALTVSSGNGGGKYAPSMVIGGCIGGAIGLLLSGMAVAPPVSACIVMGMGGVLAANYKTPIAALLMVCELTGDYSLLLPAMWVSALSFLTSGRKGLLPSQVRSVVHSTAHNGHFFSDIMATIRVEKVFNREKNTQTLLPSSTLDECKKLITDTHQNIYPVVTNNGIMSGIFGMNDLRSFLYDESLGLVVVAQDIATTDIITITTEDSLTTAMRRFTERNLDALPVVVSDDDWTFLGLLTRREVIAYYNNVVEDIREKRKEDGYLDEAKA